MYTVCLSPSNQTENRYAYGNTTEAEQCQRIANAAQRALERCGIKVIMAGNTLGMAKKCQLSDAGNADLHVPIHTNAGGGGYGGTRVFCSVIDTGANGYKAAAAICKRLAPITPGTISERVVAYPSLYEISTPKAPTAYIEVDFHDVVDIAKWIIANVDKIGETIAQGICDYFGVEYVSPDQPKPAPAPKHDGHDWSKDAREKAIAKGIVKGTGTNPDGSIYYAWEEPLTREQLVTILDRMDLI